MKVLRCEIKNYRSIKKMEIDTQDRLKVFIGHNEAGKSNIIKALSLLDPQTPISKDDIRDNLSDEGIISESYVCFTFKFEDFELIELETEIQKKILPHHRNQRFIKHSDGSIYSLKEFLVKNNEIFYMINLKEQTKYENFVSPTKYGLVETVKGIKPGSSFSYEYEKKSYNINQFQYLIQNEEMQIPENYLIDTKFEKFYTDYLIVSDSDKPAVEAKEKFHTQNKWLKYNDFNKEIVTSEDYITIDYNIECFKQACNYFSIKVYEEDLPQSTNNIVENFTKVLDKQKIDKNVRKNILNKYKSLIIDGLSIENINQKYTIFVDSLLKKI